MKYLIIVVLLVIAGCGANPAGPQTTPIPIVTPTTTAIPATTIPSKISIYIETEAIGQALVSYRNNAGGISQGQIVSPCKYKWDIPSGSVVAMNISVDNTGKHYIYITIEE